MYYNPFVSQLVAKERAQDAMRQAEKARLMRAAAGSSSSWQWYSQVMLRLKNWRSWFENNRVPRAQIRSVPR